MELYREQFGEVLPPELAILADRGFDTIRALLPNLNKVYVPAFLRKAERGAEQFAPTEVTWSRTRARLRYAIETAFARVTHWAYLKDRVDYEKLSLANEVWHWAHGFANMYRQPLQEYGEGEEEEDAFVNHHHTTN